MRTSALACGVPITLNDDRFTVTGPAGVVTVGEGVGAMLVSVIVGTLTGVEALLAASVAVARKRLALDAISGVVMALYTHSH